MLLNKLPHYKGIYRRIGIFLLLLMDNAVTEDIDTEALEEVNYNKGPDKTTEATEEVNYNIILDEPTPSLEDKNGNVATKYSTSFRNLQYMSPAVMKAVLIRYSIIPDVLAISPSYLTEVIYSQRWKVNFGNKVAPEMLQKQPRKVIWPWHNDSFYSLVLVDADVPTRWNHKFGQRLHWLVVNIPGYRLDRGDHIVEYIGPIAPRQTGLHRYVFTVFKQYSQLEYKEKRIKSSSNKWNPDRLNFSVRDFATKYKLRDPVSVNFYLTGWPLDQFVPEATPAPRRPRN